MSGKREQKILSVQSALRKWSTRVSLPGGLLNERETGRGRELHFLLPGETDDKVEESTNCLVFIYISWACGLGGGGVCDHQRVEWHSHILLLIKYSTTISQPTGTAGCLWIEWCENLMFSRVYQNLHNILVVLRLFWWRGAVWSLILLEIAVYWKVYACNISCQLHKN